jgi:TonB family protein
MKHIEKKCIFRFKGQEFLSRYLVLVFFAMFSNTSFGQTIDSIETKSNDTSYKKQTDSATVHVMFSVDTSGAVSDVKVVEIICKDCTRKEKKAFKSEAIRLVKRVTGIKPRTHKERFRIPITFKIE